MSRVTLCLLFCSFLSLIKVQGQSIKDLDFLIGNWELKEVVYEGTAKEYTELGKRTCSYEVEDTYISCTTTASRKGKERVYVSKINYDRSKQLFRMTTQFSDFDFRGNYQLLLFPELKQLSVIPNFSMEDEGFYRSVIDYSDADKLIWKGYQSGFKGIPVWENFYTETAIRVK